MSVPVITGHSFVVEACDKNGASPMSKLNIRYTSNDRELQFSTPMTPTEYQNFLQMSTGTNDFYYSPKYEDEDYEYRHVHVTKEVAKMIPKNRLMSETEWRSLGIQQSPGWMHYMIHGPERHVLLFRRPLPDHQPPAQANVRARVNAR